MEASEVVRAADVAVHAAVQAVLAVRVVPAASAAAHAAEAVQREAAAQGAGTDFWLHGSKVKYGKSTRIQ